VSRILYLGQAIDRALELNQISADVSRISAAAESLGWLVYRPGRAWAVAPSATPGPELEAINRAVLENAGLFVGISHESPTVGMWRELEMAKTIGMPCAVLGASVTWSLTDAHVFHDPSDLVYWLVSLGAPDPGPFEGDPRPGVMVPFAQASTEHLGALPSRSYPGDAGFDLYAAAAVEIEPGEFRDVPCGVRCALPPTVWGRITGRSSTLRRRGLMVAEGVIDSGYRGPLFAGVWNLGTDSARVEAGERIAQLLMHVNVARLHEPVWFAPDEFDALPGDGRGDHGFGSTGL